MIDRRFQEQLLTAFPESTWDGIARGLRDGILLADNVIAETPLLSSVLGQDIRGFVRRAGILYKFKGLCVAGDLPFVAAEERMPVGCWHWLTMKAQNICTHIVKTESPRALPNDNVSRQPECLKNQFDLFEDGRIPDRKDTDAEKERYAVIVYGLTPDSKLAYAAVGMPNYERTGWLAYKNILRGDRLSVPQAPVVAPTPDAAASLQFLEDVQRMLEERDQDQSTKKIS